MKNHLINFRIVYIQALIAVAASVAGELATLKDFTHEQLAALTWVTWTVLVANVIITAGNNIVASLHAPPGPSSQPKEPTP